MTDQSIWFLENIDVTGLFCPKKLGSQEDHLIHKEFKKGTYIYLPDESSDRIFFLTFGRVKIGTYGDSGKEVTKAILTKGEVFGELALLGEERRRDFAYAMEDSGVCLLTVEEMRELMRDHSALNLFLMRVLGSRVLEMENRLESLVFKDSRSRIIELLLEMNRKHGERVGYEHVVRKFITHQDIANLTATSRQTVTTVLNELRNKNLLTFNRKRLLIRDLDRLSSEVGQAS
ncbi:MAG: Crp/Fnr family transcriptional regulator [Saprospiraceae bacterium]|nr:Crp/Fnr family transcriptional regulator [Saprospiraceae bacterium]